MSEIYQGTGIGILMCAIFIQMNVIYQVPWSWLTLGMIGIGAVFVHRGTGKAEDLYEQRYKEEE